MNTESTTPCNDGTHPKPEAAPLVVDNATDLHPVPAVPHRSGRSTSQTSEHKHLINKRRPDSLEENISEQQRSRIVEWLADHSYNETKMLIAAEPPAGFGLHVGKTTLCRFYKAHYLEIERIRQRNIEDRMELSYRVNAGGDYVVGLQDTTRQMLLERFFEMLSRPVESIDDLKKLVVIGDKMRHLHTKDPTASDLMLLLQKAKPSPTQ
jgi:hypothetical protein